MTGSLRSLCIEFSARKKVFECPSCPKKFKKPSALKVHSYSHTGEKPFKCQACDKDFSVLSNLRRHIKLHIKPPHHHRSFISSSRCSPSPSSNSPKSLMPARQHHSVVSVDENSGSFISAIASSYSSPSWSSSSLPFLSSSVLSSYSSSSIPRSSLLTEETDGGYFAFVSTSGLPLTTSSAFDSGIPYHPFSHNVNVPSAPLFQLTTPSSDGSGMMHVIEDHQTICTSSSHLSDDTYSDDPKPTVIYQHPVQDVWVTTTLEQLNILPS